MTYDIDFIAEETDLDPVDGRAVSGYAEYGAYDLWSSLVRVVARRGISAEERSRLNRWAHDAAARLQDAGPDAGPDADGWTRENDGRWRHWIAQEAA